MRKINHVRQEAVNLAAIRGKIDEIIVPAISLGPENRSMSSEAAGDSNSNKADATGESELFIPDMLNITDQALYEMTAIPLYFPISYSLIKPYVQGFEVNGLDAPSLKEVSVDNNWQPGASNKES